MITLPDVKLISGRATTYLSERIADVYGQELTNMHVQEFSDGEFEPIIMESVRGSFVFVIQSTFSPSENLMELLLLIDAAKRASAGYSATWTTSWCDKTGRPPIRVSTESGF